MSGTSLGKTRFNLFLDSLDFREAHSRYDGVVLTDNVFVVIDMRACSMPNPLTR